jgi:hypothetical protein
VASATYQCCRTDRPPVLSTTGFQGVLAGNVLSVERRDSFYCSESKRYGIGLLLLPNRGHGFSAEPYMMRRRWDYFVRYLLGADPPGGYELHPPAIGARP